MRTTTEFFLGKGKHEYFVTGTLWVDDHPHPLDLEQSKRQVVKMYVEKPWIDSDHPTVLLPATVTVVRIPKNGKKNLFEALCGDSGHIWIEISLNNYPLRQSQLRSFEKYMAGFVDNLRAIYSFRQMACGVKTWKQVGR